MKKLLAQSLVAALLFLIGGGAANAQISPCKDGVNQITGEKCANAVTSAVPFLRIVPDARGGAMGDVGIATSVDANGMHYNASKLAFADKRVSISATYTPWMRNLGLNDVYLAYLSGYYRLDKRQAVGASLRYFSLGDIEFTDDTGQSLGQGRPNEFEFSGAYARKLSEKFSASVGAKFIYSNLATGRVVEGNEIKPGVAGAADISLTYKTPIKMGERKGEFIFGTAVSNIGSKITYTNSVNRDYIPTNLGIGAGLKLQLDEFNSITFSTDFNKLLVPTPRTDLGDADGNGVVDYKDYSPIRGIFKSFADAPGGFSEELKEITLGIGAEYWYDDQFAVRIGHFREHYSKGNRKYFSVGLGVKYNIFGLNFSYLVPTSNQRNPLDNTLRFSLVFDFSAFEGEED